MHAGFHPGMKAAGVTRHALAEYRIWFSIGGGCAVPFGVVVLLFLTC
jgi:hypothetical protein